MYVGGISGENTGTISGSRTDVNLMGGQMGGIAGVNSGTITRSYSASNLGDGGYGTAGGLVGTNTATGIITESFHTGSVSAGYYSSYYGGLAGYNAGMIARSYNLGMVYPGFLNGAVGGLVGYNHTTGTIINSYNGGAIAFGQAENGPIGGIVAVMPALLLTLIAMPHLIINTAQPVRIAMVMSVATPATSPMVSGIWALLATPEVMPLILVRLTDCMPAALATRLAMAPLPFTNATNAGGYRAEFSKIQFVYNRRSDLGYEHGMEYG